MRTLVVGWPSFLHGEATAGDVAAMRRVAGHLREEGIACDTAWSPGFRPGERSLDDAEPVDYTDVVFVCGPAHGSQLRELHRRYARCRRHAVGVTVVDGDDPAVTGFDEVLPRDGPGLEPARDLAAQQHETTVPVVGVILAPGQPEYAEKRRHEHVHAELGRWIARQDCAPLELDTRLDTRDWRHCSTPEQFSALVARTDFVVTTRLHGLVFALSQGVPALAVDPVAGGGKVSAQAAAWDWPAVLTTRDIGDDAGAAEEELGRWWRWCSRPEGAEHARARARTAGCAGPALSTLIEGLHGNGERGRG